MDPAFTALIILGVIIILYITEVIPLALTSVAGCIAMVLFGVIEFNEAFSGFSATVVFLVGGMMFVGNALFDTGGAALIGKKVKSMGKSSEKKILMIIMIVCGILSAFLSNSATTAMFISIIFGMAGGSVLFRRRMLMPLAFSANSGGMLTLIGSTPPVIVQGVLTEAGYRPLSFFEFALIGAPVFAFVVIYMMTIGYSQLSKMGYKNDEAEAELISDSADEDLEEQSEQKDTTKMKLTFGILGFCIILFATGVIPSHLTSIIGAWLVMVTGCLKFKKAFKNYDWTTIFILAGSLGIARGIELSGAAELIANGILNVGFADQPIMIMAIFIAAGMIFTQIVSNTAATAMLAPIGLFLAQGMGVSPYPFMLGLCTLAAAGFTTPVATPPNTMVLIGGYDFKDYLRIGGVLNLLVLGLTILLAPLIWPF